MKLPPFPPRFYLALICDPAGEWIVDENIGETASDAVSSAIEHTDCSFRVLEFDIDPDTNMPDRPSDVTEDACLEFQKLPNVEDPIIPCAIEREEYAEYQEVENAKWSAHEHDERSMRGVY